MTKLTILAGAAAARHIRERGLSPRDIAAVFGASGAAKWLAIYGLDRAIFADWLVRSEEPIDLFGTSVGAFKLAAAARENPSEALTRLAHAYIDQDYVGKDLATQVVVETDRILDTFLDPVGVAEILASRRYSFHCGSVRCRGWLGSHDLARQKAAMATAFLGSLTGRSAHRKLLERCIFFAGRPRQSFDGLDGFRTHRVPLNAGNFRAAIRSSGSIPVVMPGVEEIPGAPPGIYRDGGLLDYHPVPSNLAVITTGLVLYPHFYPHLKEGWFDKFWPWRRAGAARLDNTVIVAPSRDFVRSLPGGQIPDRRDFQRFAANDSERVRRWRCVLDRSVELGDEFLELVGSGDIAARVQTLE